MNYMNFYSGIPEKAIDVISRLGGPIEDQKIGAVHGFKIPLPDPWERF
jgi:hypothetical protein